jgi:predicted membrane channel-forming protein YqfA (hemolysin III family)
MQPDMDVSQAIFPGIKGYPHFQFADYAKLTVIGVLIACAAWPVTTRITSRPRWMFFRMAVLVTLVLWLPDVYLLMKGQPAKAVAFLFLMHLAIALVTYHALVHLAPIREQRHTSHRRAQPVRR